MVRPNAKDPAFEEIAIPGRIREFKADLSSIGGFLKPTQEMANFISLEIARGRSKVPAYTPFAVPDLSAAPWAVSSKEHDAAVSRWGTSSRVADREGAANSIPTQAWLLYNLRFVIAADLAGDWSAFGGIAAQLNHLSIIMHIPTTDSAAIALSYDRMAREFLAEKARSRQKVDIAAFSTDFLSVGNPALKLRAIAEHPPLNRCSEGPREGKRETEEGRQEGSSFRKPRRPLERPPQRPLEEPTGEEAPLAVSVPFPPKRSQRRQPPKKKDMKTMR